jgi:hypothetical protein
LLQKKSKWIGLPPVLKFLDFGFFLSRPSLRSARWLLEDGMESVEALQQFSRATWCSENIEISAR